MTANGRLCLEFQKYHSQGVFDTPIKTPKALRMSWSGVGPGARSPFVTSHKSIRAYDYARGLLFRFLFLGSDASRSARRHPSPINHVLAEFPVGPGSGVPYCILCRRSTPVRHDNHVLYARALLYVYVSEARFLQTTIPAT